MRWADAAPMQTPRPKQRPRRRLHPRHRRMWPTRAAARAAPAPQPALAYGDKGAKGVMREGNEGVDCGVGVQDVEISWLRAGDIPRTPPRSGGGPADGPAVYCAVFWLVVGAAVAVGAIVSSAQLHGPQLEQCANGL